MSKGGSTSDAEVPEYLKQQHEKNLNRSDALADIGYLPWTGPTVAEVNPWERLGAQQQNAASGAFGLGTAQPFSNLPPVVEQGGVRGYSDYPLFNANVDNLQWAAPEFDARYREWLNLPSEGSVYGPTDNAANPLPAPPPLNFDSMNNGQLLDLIIASGYTTDKEGNQVMADMAQDPAFRNNVGLNNYDVDAAIAAGEIDPAHGNFIKGLQAQLATLQQATQRGGTPGETARGGNIDPFAPNGPDAVYRQGRFGRWVDADGNIVNLTVDE